MNYRILVAAFLLGAVPVAQPWAQQVSVNSGALDALGKPAGTTGSRIDGNPGHRSSSARAKAAARTHRRHAHETSKTESRSAGGTPKVMPISVPAAEPHTLTKAEPRNATAAEPYNATKSPTSSAPAPPSIPAAPPVAAAVPPPGAFVPTRPTPPPPPIPVVADAPGAASKLDDGMRVTFGPDRADFNPATVTALRGLAQTAAAQPGTPVNVAAYAAGTPEDPSTPRRLALSRALAARAVLVNEGLPSTRIYVRALGTNDPGGGPSDRVDITLGAPSQDANAAAPSAASAGTAK